MISVRQLLAQKPTGGAYSVESTAPVISALKLMAEKHLGAVLVMRGSELVGIMSERDYARKVVLLGRTSADTPVAEIMSSPVITVTPDDRVNDCMRMMTEKRFRHLPVVENGKVVGVVSIGDVVKAVIAQQERAIADLEDYIHH
jgi:CBS domain-containing protein